MPLLEINPRTLRGPWNAGYALDWQTLSITPIGQNQWGHMQFDTKRSPVRQLLYQLKYRNDQAAVQTLADTAANFIRHTWRIPPIDAIVPTPPSMTIFTAPARPSDISVKA